MRVGQVARVVADAYPGVEWRARVSAIAPATGAEFALLPPQNATGNWIKVVQRVPVLFAIEPDAGGPQGPPGAARRHDGQRQHRYRPQPRPARSARRVRPLKVCRRRERAGSSAF